MLRNEEIEEPLETQTVLESGPVDFAVDYGSNKENPGSDENGRTSALPPFEESSRHELLKELKELRGELEVGKDLSQEMSSQLVALKKENEDLVLVKESLQNENTALIEQLQAERSKFAEQSTEIETMRNTIHNMERLHLPSDSNMLPPSPAPRKKKASDEDDAEGSETDEVPAVVIQGVPNGNDDDETVGNRETTVIADNAGAVNTDENADENEVFEKEDDDVRSKEDQDATSSLTEVTDPSQDVNLLHIQIRVLSQENESLREVVKSLRFKYDQAIAALKDVEASFQQRDQMVEHYKQELENIAKEQEEGKFRRTGDSDTIELRNGLLDTRLQLERLKNAQENQVTHMSDINGKLEPIVLSLHESQRECHELKARIEHLQTELDMARGYEGERKHLMEDLRNVRNALESSEIVVKNLENLLENEKKARMTFEVENELIPPLKEQVSSLEKDLEALSTKLKLKTTKYKYVKKELERHINEVEELKIAAERLSDLQRDFDLVATKNDDLKDQLESLRQNEADRITRETEQKRREEEHRQLEKEAWEKRLVLNNERLYEVVNFRNGHDVQGKFQNGLDPERPKSAPHPKQHSYDGRRMFLSNGNRWTFPKGSSPPSSIINPNYINSYPQAIKATNRIHRRQQAHLEASRKLKRDRTKPLSTKQPSPPLLPSPGRDPKVLLYDSRGEREGKRLLAKGDVVMINTALPPENGEKIGSHLFDVTGIVHYIGPRSEDDQQIHVGIVLDQPVGDHDGKVDGRRYFKCDAPYGKLVKLTEVISVLKHGAITAES